MHQPLAAVPTASEKIGLHVRGVRKRYGKTSVLDGVTLDVRPGEFLTLLGPSGSGKTTLLMVIAGFVRPESGEVLLGPQDIVRRPPHERGVGMMFQNYALFPHMTVGENIAYPLKLRGVPPAERAERVAVALDLVQLAGYQDRSIDALSGGQKQRIALARATVFRPRLLLMDEPLSALDKKLREQMQIELRRLHQQLGMTTICVTHDQREALTMSDRIAVMHGGNIVQLGTPTQLYEAPANEFVADFIGESTILPIDASGDRPRLRGRLLHLPRDCRPGADSRVVIRPERLVVLEAGQDGAGMNVFEGTVSHCVYEGESVVVHVDVGEAAPLRARMLARRDGGGAAPAAGSAVRVALHADDTIVVAA
ncbi:ABC transporter ATP-binding protein [Verticiella sediminum]|uniref:Spermidine/putrescine import ATP-binding protein PotA n=1 Tax=Verticiella sediminum TaxID=1247510 RepID=A0A556AU01_9BURK|nr:ABC transporter ATP-binding protein [Verticiella sediminum]TSH96424.1 ABC transporter ATP-binding protein [Verticiella sediminum]